MKRIILLTLSLILVACTPQVTVTSEVTVTLAPPTQTLIPLPTETPAPTLSPETQAKFDEAGIDLNDIENTTVNPDDSFTIVNNGKEYIANLKFIDESKVTFGYEDGNIILDGENLKVIPFEIMELSIDPNKPSVCTAEDYFSGQVAWNERRNAKPFPADAVNAGWGKSEIAGNDGLYLQPGSVKAIELSSVCRITGDFLGTENLYDIVGVEVLNVDGSTSGFLHFFTDRRLKVNAKYIIEEIKKGEIGIYKQIPEGKIKEFQNDSTNGPLFRLYEAQGGNQRMQDLIVKLILSKAIPAEMETILLKFVDYDPRN